jgi:hypothetical protein
MRGQGRYGARATGSVKWGVCEPEKRRRTRTRRGLEGLLALTNPERKAKRRKEKRAEGNSEDERISMGE